MPTKHEASQQIKLIAMDALTPVINHERFELIIKMAAGFHALAEKGYPGAQEFLNKIFDLLGEHFQADFKKDDQELLHLQSVFLKSLKNKEFYEQKLSQFIKGATINLNKHDDPVKPGEDRKSDSKAERMIKDILGEIKKIEEEVRENAKKTGEDKEITAAKIKDKTQGLQDQIASIREEANKDQARSRYDAIMKKFYKISTDQKFIANLDTNGIALMTALDHAAFQLSQLDDGKRVVKLIADTLPAREKSTPANVTSKPSVLMHLVTKVIKHLISNPLSIEKHQIDRLVKSIATSSLESMPVSPEPKELPDSSLWDNVNKLWNFLQNPSDLDPTTQELDVPVLINISRLEVETTVLTIFEKDLKSLELLQKNGLIDSKEWGHQIEKMKNLSTKLATLEKEHEALKLKKVSNPNSLELAQAFDNLQARKTELFKDAFLELEKLSQIPINSKNNHLIALAEVTQYAVFRLNLAYHILTAASAGYRSFTEQREVYQNPFKKLNANAPALGKNKNNGVKRYLKKHMDDILKNAAIKQAVELGKLPFLHRLKSIDMFSEKLPGELEREREPAKESPSQTPELLAHDILAELNREIDSIEQDLKPLQDAWEIEKEALRAEEDLAEKANQETVDPAEGWFGFLGRKVLDVANVAITAPAALSELAFGNAHINRMDELEAEMQPLKESLNPFKRMQQAISDANDLGTHEYKQLNKFHNQFKILEKIKADPMHKAHQISTIHRQIHIELNSIIQNLSWKNLGTKDKTNFDNQLKLAKATIVYLDTLGKDLESKPIARLRANLNDKITTYELLNKSDEKFANLAEQIATHTTQHTDSTIKALFKNEQIHSFSFLKGMQLSQRKGDIQFLQKVIDLLNHPDSKTLLPANKAAIMIGALNHLDNELHSSFFTFGVNNFKHMIRNLKNETFKELQEGSPEQYQLYKALEAGSQDALKEFIKDHSKNFKHLPDAQKFLKQPQQEKSMLHQRNGNHHNQKVKLEKQDLTLELDNGNKPTRAINKTS